MKGRVFLGFMALAILIGTLVGFAHAQTRDPVYMRGCYYLQIECQTSAPSDSNYSILATDETVGISSALTSARTFTLPCANAVNSGRKINLLDATGAAVSALAPAIVQTSAGGCSDALNGAAGNTVSLSVPGAWAIAESDGVSKWTVEVFSPPAKAQTLSALGWQTASINGDQQYQWTAGGHHFTNGSHTWTAQEVAALAANPALWKVQVQFSDNSGNNRDLVTHICGNAASDTITDCGANGHRPTAGTTDFYVYDAPAATNASGANTLKVVNEVDVQNGGDHVGLGHKICFDKAAGGSATLLQKICGVPAEVGVSPTGTAIANGGTAGSGSATYTGCTLAITWSKLPPSIGGLAENYALKSNIPLFTITTTAGVATAVTVSFSGTIEALNYTYNASGLYPGVPVSCAGAGFPTGVTLNLSLLVVQLQNSAGQDATGGLANAVNFNNSCSAASPATDAASPPAGDHSANVTASCKSNQAIVYAFYDNQTNAKNLQAWLNSLTPEARPRIVVDGVYGLTPIDGRNACPGGTCGPNAPIFNGQAYFEGATPNSGFLQLADGTHYGAAIDWLKTGRSGSILSNGLLGTDSVNPDQAGAGMVNLTFYGIDTGVRSTSDAICASRLFGPSGKMLFRDIRLVNLPGGLHCAGAYQGNGDFAESTEWNIRSGNSGDQASQTPVDDWWSVGPISGPNNDKLFGLRSTGDNYYTFAHTGCGGPGNGGGHDQVHGFKDEAGGGDTYANGGYGELIVNRPCADPITGLGIHFPQADSASDLVGLPWASGACSNLCAGGASDVAIDGSCENPSLGTSCATVVANSSGDISNVRFTDFPLNGGSGSGAGLLWAGGCGNTCWADTPSSGTTDWGLIFTGSSFSSVDWENDGNPNVPNMDGGITIRCEKWAGIIDPPTGNCNLDLSRVTGTLPAGHLPNPTATTLGGVKSATAAAHNFQTGIDTSGNPIFAQPACADVSDASSFCNGTSAAGLTGTVAAARLNPAINGHLYLGNNTGINTAAGFVQPKCADLSDASAFCNGTSAAGLTGTVGSANGGAGAVTGALKGDGSGNVSQAACADLSNASSFCSGTSAAGLTGTVAAARLNPAVNGHLYLGNNTGINTAAGFVQPKCTDLSDSATSCNTDATNASNTSSGLLAAPRFLPSLSQYGTRWVLPALAGTGIGAGAAPGTGTVVCSPGLILAKATLSAIGAKTSTTSSGNHVQLAIYNAGSWGKPSTVAASTGDIALGASAGQINGAVSTQLDAGVYWFCENADNAVVVFISYLATAPNGLAWFSGSNSQGNVIGTSGLQCGLSIAQTYGTWPSFTSGTSWTQPSTAVCPQIGFNISSVP